MLWRTIDSLGSGELSRRAAELRNQLAAFSDQELIAFHREAVSAFQSLFTPSLYYLYCAVFDGEVNGSGLTDFCSNIILAGRQLFEAVSTSPDRFAEVADVVPFNDDYGIDVSEASRSLLIKRHGEEAFDEMLLREGIHTLEGIWDHLESQVESLTFEPDWRIVEETMPRVFSRFRPMRKGSGE